MRLYLKLTIEFDIIPFIQIQKGWGNSYQIITGFNLKWLFLKICYRKGK
jgi:hypothetical protein